jgi:hypothetical protein
MHTYDVLVYLGMHAAVDATGSVSPATLPVLAGVCAHGSRPVTGLSILLAMCAAAVLVVWSGPLICLCSNSVTAQLKSHSLKWMPVMQLLRVGRVVAELSAERDATDDACETTL